MMSKLKFLVMILLAMTIAVSAWSSVQAASAKPKVTTDDVARKFGKVPPSEQKAAQKRARKMGLQPGVAGRVAPAPAGQAPETDKAQ
ncbi:MAG: hypothetical protein HY787_30015 [Deltaproteobacteria bacterium]|nr:hypothetical protein [Deltaproteobacteria bacterium]